MEGNHHPYWLPYGYAPDGRPVFAPPHPEAYAPPLEFSAQDPGVAPQYPMYPYQDVGPGGGPHEAMLTHLDVPHERKHRRSRNGCFTCRTRRVKCDEKRPACDRCRKGCRECVYPSPSENPKKKSKGGSSTASGRDALPDDDLDGSASPPPSNTAPASSPRETPPSSASPTPLATLLEAPGNVKTHHFYLEWSRSHLTYHHYGLSVPSPQLIPGQLTYLATRFKPLLHAVTAYAAYHYALTEEDASVKDFIWHYSESVSDLRTYLVDTKGSMQVPVLLTILQLATIEEYLGDWVNLISHHMAATKILTSLFKPETVMREPLSRDILDWHGHFDLFSSYIGGKGLNIGREWYVARHDYWRLRVQDEPANLVVLNAERHARMHLLGAEIAVFFRELSSGALSERTIERRAIEFKTDIFDILGHMGPLVDPSKRAMSQASPPAAVDPSGQGVQSGMNSPISSRVDDGGNPWDPIEYYTEPLWSTNYLILRGWGCYTMLLSHLLPQQFWRGGKEPAVSPGKTVLGNPQSELRRYSMLMCRLFAAISSHDPDPGAIMGAQAGISFGSCFVGSVSSNALAPQHVQWCREQLMRVESRGYIFPMGMRKRMSDAWGVDVAEWWFPDGRGLGDTLRAIREFVVYRTRPAEDELSEDVREMNGLFSAMQVGEDSASGEDEDVKDEDVKDEDVS